MSAGVTRTEVEIVTRSLESDLPAYTLRGYLLIWHAYNGFRQPIAAGKTRLPDLAPGSVHREIVTWDSFEGLREVHVEIYRPTGYSVLESDWKAGE